MLSRPFATLAFVLALGVTAAHAQRGQFDKTPVNPADEALVFKPRGFDLPGKPAVARGENVARLEVTIVDTATSELTLCRVNVVGADGNFYFPKENRLAAFNLSGTWPETLAGNRPGKAPIRYFGKFFYTPGHFTVEVPAGPVRIEAWKGFEYRPVARETTLAAGATGDVKLSLTRAAPMAERGYYSGNPHLHFIRASDNDERTIFDLIEAEDIRFGMVLAYNETNAYPGLMPELVTPQLRGLGYQSVARRGEHQILSGQEYRNVVFGHVLLLGRPSLVLEGQKLDPNLGPVFGEIAVETRKLGGYSFHAHGGYAQEIWADLVQGATDGVELLQFGIYRGIGLDGWYRVLNCGFRFPGVGACDYPACRKLGDCRTYVHIDGEPTFEKWLAGAAAGRSFMTSAPLLLLEVDGRRPGDIITTSDANPKSVPVRLEVTSETAPVTDVHLVVNGRVVKEWKLTPKPGEPQQVTFDETLELKEPGWIAARAFSRAPSGSADAEAHTNPVYVYLNGRRPYVESDLDWLAARLDEQIADHAARKEPERDAAVKYFERSREILAEIKQNSGMLAARPFSPEPTATESQTSDDLAEILKPVLALSPADALQSFEVQDGFRMELVAHEPDVVDPVAACFDEHGGMYVCEMIDYPYRPKEGQTPLGRVRYLVDADGDGRYEQSSVFAEGLAWPTGVVCWKGGVYVAAAPDIWYLRDTNGDRVADERTRVYTGFGDRNQQGSVNNLAWGIDHKIYGAGSTNGGEIRPGDKPDAMPIVLSGRDFRFDPVTGTFETVTGRQQFGNAFDDWFNRFICSESNPLVHVVLPQEALARNPFLAVPSGINDLAPGVTPIFRTSPIEKWREIRSNRRLAAGERGADSAGLSHNVIDAAAGLCVYRGHAYPSEYRGQVFVGCSQNNLIHRRRLIAAGASFRSERIDENTEFVRSTDTWFRPVNCLNAPDGTLFVLDMSREVIESIHIANDVVKHLDLTSGRDKGRIYRLAPPGFQSPAPPRLGQAGMAELAQALEHQSGWWRDTASRLIFERQDRSIAPHLRQRLRLAESDVGRLHILWALAGLDSLGDDDLLQSLNDRSAGVRAHAVRLASSRLHGSKQLVEKVISLAGDSDAAVRFQVAIALGNTSDPRAVPPLAEIATSDVSDPWMRAAALSSASATAAALASHLAGKSDFVSNAGSQAWLVQLAAIVAGRNRTEEIAQVLDAATRLPDGPKRAIVLALGAPLARAGKPLAALQADLPAAASEMLTELIEKSAAELRDRQASRGDRIQGLRITACSGHPQSTELLAALVDPLEPETLQLESLRALTTADNPEIAERLIGVWRRSTPAVQEAIISQLAGRPAWAVKLLDACAERSVTPGQISGATRAALLQHPDKAVHSRAEKVLGAGTGARAEVIQHYQAALSLTGDTTRGAAVYQRECQACHRLGDRGAVVGPNLALVRNRTPAALVEAILDPSREVQPKYVNYLVIDTSGRTLTGLVATETANSVTLVREKGVEETILKTDIETLQSTGKSLMPEGLEKTIDPQAMADLLAYLAEVRYDIGTLPDFAEPRE